MSVNLGTINGENIIQYNVRGYEQGLIKEGFKNIKDIYYFIKELKQKDKKENIKDVYVVDIETDKSIYGDCTISKYKSRYKLTYSKTIRY